MMVVVTFKKPMNDFKMRPPFTSFKINTDLEIIILSEVSQTEIDKYHMI